MSLQDNARCSAACSSTVTEGFAPSLRGAKSEAAEHDLQPAASCNCEWGVVSVLMSRSCISDGRHSPGASSSMHIT